MIISMIAAMDNKRGIGYQNKIPWHIKEDLLRFKNLTLGKTIIVGRKTYESLLGYYEKSGKPMPDRRTIVITKNKNITKKQNIYFCNSIEQAIELAKKIEPNEVVISGGSSIFAQGIKYASHLYLTIIDGEFITDTYFPDYLDFKKVIKEEKKTDGKFTYRFIALEK